MSNAWFILVVAGFLEVCWAIGLKYTESFTKIVPSLLTVTAIVLSMFLLSKAVQVLPVSTAYAVWVGIGALGATIFGIILLGEPVNTAKIIFSILLVVSIIGLKLSA
ncbi:quaternary ammonium compound-resistance protein SugE [Bacteriovorax sp. BSW11_IV]|uniref:quaternary ammonium compound efflux SMR transporter SugE n=1 Tax=Bacteriovorax sp. BSW11_IV TaxID=1353529 RepID=UPI00038A3CEE|nr:quaternary ammonium compound efflux SMR transporter SugE [Bacteriovorax sp. BSW11_IV]EQC49550.1 quaternary ammonium compound-resistance protein SugE [Bacteriovorax sp. BSW11_IV]